MTIKELPSPWGHVGSYCERSCGVLAQGCPLVSLEVVLNLESAGELDRWNLEVCGPRCLVKDVPRVTLFADDLVCILGALARVPNEGRVQRRDRGGAGLLEVGGKGSTHGRFVLLA